MTTAHAPPLPSPFHPAGEHVAVDLPGAHVRFTTRRGGVSRPPYDSLNLGLLTGDDPEAVRANWGIVADHVGVPGERFARGRQVHGTTVARLTAPPDPVVVPDGVDGQATNVPGVAATVLVADCLPVAVAGTNAVAMLHAGWRGLAAGILAEGVRALRELGADGRLAAAIGPGAGGCCYETGDEVRAEFPARHAAGRLLDLKAVAREQLLDAGVAEVHDSGLCTLCGDPSLFFSHRRDEGLTGRQAGVAWLAADGGPVSGRQAGVAWLAADGGPVSGRAGSAWPS